MRVPAVLVSPFVPRGTVISEVYDHTSIIATASRLFVNSAPTFLTQRDRAAKTFEGCVTLSTPRQGRVIIPKNPAPVPEASSFAATHHSSLMGLAGAAGGGAKPATGTAAAKKALQEELAMGTQARADSPVSELQAAMISQAFAFERRLPPAERTGVLVSSISTEREAADYFAAIRERLAARMSGGSVGGRAPAKTRGRKSVGKSTVKPGGKRARQAGAKKR